MVAKLIDTTSRSIVKSISFRILIIISDGVIVYLITRKLDLAITVILVRNAAATVLYYFHERFWNKITWGKKRK